jgi:hypothetical protein
MAKVIIKNNELQVSIGALETIQALQGSFSLPLSSVRGATEDPNYIRAGIGFRSPGTGLPGFIAKGTFRRIGEKTLSLWRKNQEIVVVVLENAKWDRLVIGCDDAKKLAGQINNAIALR